MPLGAARLTLLAFQPSVAVEAEVIRRKVGVTAVGNAQVDTAQSKFGGASAVFDGSGDYLLADQSAGSFGSDPFTVEAWVRTASASGSFESIASIWHGSTAGNRSWFLGVDDNTQHIVFFWYDSSNNIDTSVESTGVLSNTTWHHVAVSSDGTTFRLFLDGTLEDSGSAETIRSPVAGSSVGVGANYDGSLPFNGHIDEFRISNTARYTSNFTPQTQPFVNDANTLLLLHMDGTDDGIRISNYFEDDNGVRRKASVRGENVALLTTNIAKFGGASYNSGISSSDRASGKRIRTDINLPDTFTVEMWFMPKEDFGSTGTHLWATRTSSSGPGINLSVEASPNTYSVYEFIGGTRYEVDSGTWSLDTWNHIAVTRSGNTVELFVDGTSQGSYTNASTADMSSLDLTIGNLGYAAVLGAPGAIDEVRISNTARYTANFTPQTEPHVNDENTLLLLHMDGTDGSTDFSDDNGARQKVGISAEGNAQISTTESQFGGASAYFDGNSNYIVAGTNTDFVFNTDDFTVEGWLRVDNHVATRCGIITKRANLAGKNNTWGININPSNNHLSVAIPVASGGDDALTSTGALSVGTWFNFAYVRSGNTHYLFLDGNLEDSLTDTRSFSYANDTLKLGTWSTGSGSDFFYNGWLDEVRISNTARYTTNFTLPTEPFQNDDNTLLLLHMDGTDGSQTFVDDNGVPPNHDYGA